MVRRLPPAPGTAPCLVCRQTWPSRPSCGSGPDPRRSRSSQPPNRPSTSACGCSHRPAARPAPLRRASRPSLTLAWPCWTLTAFRRSQCVRAQRGLLALARRSMPGWRCSRHPQPCARMRPKTEEPSARLSSRQAEQPLPLHHTPAPRCAAGGRATMARRTAPSPMLPPTARQKRSTFSCASSTTRASPPATFSSTQGKLLAWLTSTPNKTTSMRNCLSPPPPPSMMHTKQQPLGPPQDAAVSAAAATLDGAAG